jgi:transcriptional regulator with XRE-family HTH domain
MNRTTGERLRALRDLKAWTQEELASAAGVGLRTVQRIESGDAPNSETLKALAAAFDVEVTALSAGLTVDDLVELRRAYTCPKCGAPLSERTFVTHEYGDAEFEIFECGCTRGWQDRPCPHDPQFPAFEDYDLHFLEGSNGDWHCFAVGRTRHGRQVGLGDGRGNSREEAEAWVRYSYIEAKDGHSTAEKYMFEHLPHLPSLSEYSQLSLALWRRPD